MDRYNYTADSPEHLTSSKRQLLYPVKDGCYSPQRHMHTVRDNSVFQSTPNLAFFGMDSPNQYNEQPYVRSTSYQQQPDGVIMLHPPSPNRNGSISPRRIILRGGSPGQTMLQQHQNNNYWGPNSPPQQPVYTSNSVVIGPEAPASAFRPTDRAYYQHGSTALPMVHEQSNPQRQRSQQQQNQQQNYLPQNQQQQDYPAQNQQQQLQQQRKIAANFNQGAEVLSPTGSSHSQTDNTQQMEKPGVEQTGPPPLPPQPEKVYGESTTTGSGPPPPPPPPPPIPAGGIPVAYAPPMSEEETLSAMTAAIQNASLRKTPKVDTSGIPPKLVGTKAVLMEEMERKLARRKARADGENPNRNEVRASPFNTTSRSNTSSPSLLAQNISRSQVRGRSPMVNGEAANTVLPKELETLKQELLTEIRQDIQQVKVDILTALLKDQYTA